MISSSTNQSTLAQQQQHQQHLQQHQQPPQRGHNVQTRDYASLQLEVFELVGARK